MKVSYPERSPTAIFAHACSALRPSSRSGWSKIVLVLMLVLLSGGLLLAAQASDARPAQRLPALEVLKRAHTEFAQGDYETARQNYLKVLPSFPDNFDILKNLGFC